MRYFLHIRSGAVLVSDLEGAEFPDLDAARREAIRSAREMLAETLRRGEILNGRAIEICTSEGKVLEVVRLRDLFNLPEDRP